jgi:hypothetical protein
MNEVTQGGNAQDTNAGHPETSCLAGGPDERARGQGQEETIMSSSKKEGGGCGCLLLLIAVLVALAVTKPSEKAHRSAIAERTPVTRVLFGVQELLGGAKLKYHNYFIFSVMTARLDKTGPEIPISLGVLGKVYYDEDKRDDAGLWAWIRSISGK